MVEEGTKEGHSREELPEHSKGLKCLFQFVWNLGLDVLDNIIILYSSIMRERVFPNHLLSLGNQS